MTPKELRGQADQLFTKRSNLMIFMQEVAEHFYPERADFTYMRSLGIDFAGDMMTSYPMMCRRELADQVGQMLRPTDKEYAHIVPIDKRRQDNDAQRWLEWAVGTQRRAMYDRRAQFSDAAKLGDNDFSAFGQCVTQITLNRTNEHLLFQNWHLRDVAWMHNADRTICMYARKCKLTAIDMRRIFKGEIHQDVARVLDGPNPEPFKEFPCYHIEVQSDLYEDGKKNNERMPWRSIWYDADHEKVMEDIPLPDNTYCVERWLKPGTSQYAFSPAVTCALPEARLLQAMTFTLLEVGEKTANPPMIATEQAVRSDISVFAGGTTWVDREYDERMGDALRSMNIDAQGLPIGREMQQESRAMIMQAFYLNKLNLPQRGTEMTAYEVGQRIQEYIRGALPIFEPMEAERNGQVWEKTFKLMYRHGAFGSALDMPKSLQAARGSMGLFKFEDVLQFQFESPLHDAIEASKGAKFIESGQYVAAAVQLDPASAALIDVKEALRDVLQGVKVPAKWVRNEVTVQQIEAQAAQAQQAQQALAAMQQGSEVVGNLATANKDNAMAAMPA